MDYEFREFDIGQLRHAYHHLSEGRLVAGKEVLASVIRDLERNQSGTSKSTKRRKARR